MAVNGLLYRGLAAWIAFASSSLPVPLSPVIYTRASVAATTGGGFSKSGGEPATETGWRSAFFSK